MVGPVSARKVIGYGRVISDKRAEIESGLALQKDLIERSALREGWEIVGFVTDSGTDVMAAARRPGFGDALATVDGGAAAAIVVTDLSLLTHSIRDFVRLVARSRNDGWALIALDKGFDTAGSEGELLADVLATFDRGKGRAQRPAARDLPADREPHPAAAPGRRLAPGNR